MPTPIEWCDETFNPWWGCERVSPACAHCYADTFARRIGMPDLWSEKDHRDEHGFRFFADPHWDEPLKWARALPDKLGRRPRIFCASMADVFEERDELREPRDRLFDLIWKTPQLDWLLLTKRPEFARAWLFNHYAHTPGGVGWGSPLPNVWMGVSIENARFTWRANVLREIPAAVRFISAEPLLGSLYDGRRDGSDRPAKSGVESHAVVAGAVHGGGNVEDVPGVRAADVCVREGREVLGLGFRPAARGEVHDDRLRDGPLPAPQRVGRAPLNLSGIDWVIIGGESGPKSRPFRLEHAREILEVCYDRGTRRAPMPAVFVKQFGAKPVSGSLHGTSFPVKLADRKGGDPAEWPQDLRIREFPRSAVPA